MALCEIWTVLSTLVKQPVFSPQIAAGNITSAYCVVSVSKASCTITNRSLFSRIFLILAISGSDITGLVALIHNILSEPVSAYRHNCMAWVGGDQCGILSGSIFQSVASSCICASLLQLRKPG